MNWHYSFLNFSHSLVSFFLYVLIPFCVSDHFSHLQQINNECYDYWKTRKERKNAKFAHINWHTEHNTNTLTNTCDQQLDQTHEHISPVNIISDYFFPKSYSLVVAQITWTVWTKVGSFMKNPSRAANPPVFISSSKP